MECQLYFLGRVMLSAGIQCNFVDCDQHGAEVILFNGEYLRAYQLKRNEIHTLKLPSLRQKGLFVGIASFTYSCHYLPTGFAIFANESAVHRMHIVQHRDFLPPVKSGLHH